MKAIQDFYTSTFAHCYGCGPANPFGHHLKSYLVGDHVEARFIADERYSGGVPDHAYGGLIASLLDCHGAASAAAFAYRARARELGDGGAPIRFVTASLLVEFVKPTPLKKELTITGRLASLEGRKARILLSLATDDVECAKGEMFAIELKAEIQPT